MGLYDQLSSEVKSVSEIEDSVLKGDTPYQTLLESISDQFTEFKSTGYIKEDKENYMDNMRNAIQLSSTINRASFDEFEIDDGTITKISDLFRDAVMELMEKIGVDLYQVEDPFKLAYILYTNFMLTDQRQNFFNFVIDFNHSHDGMESELSIAYANMLGDKPMDLYRLAGNMFVAPGVYGMIVPFLKSCGYEEIVSWVEDGFLPETVLFDVFLQMELNFDLMFLNYYQMKKEALA